MVHCHRRRWKARCPSAFGVFGSSLLTATAMATTRRVRGVVSQQTPHRAWNGFQARRDDGRLGVAGHVATRRARRREMFLWEPSWNPTRRHSRRLRRLNALSTYFVYSCYRPPSRRLLVFPTPTLCRRSGDSISQSVTMFVPVVAVLLVTIVLCDSVLAFIPVCCPSGQNGWPDACRPASESNDSASWAAYPTPEASRVASMTNSTYKPIKCEHMTFLDPSEYVLQQDGTLLIINSTVTYSPADYCIAEYEDLVVPFVCMQPPEEPISAAYHIGMMLSVPFLLATIFTYVIVSRLHNLHGFCLIFHCSSLTISYIFLIIIQLYTDDLPPAVCLTMGFAVQFFFLATFFWLNVMCIDICWAFSGFKLLRGSASERDRKKLLFYSLYAWGMPLLILTFTVVVDYSDAVPATSLFKPGIGIDKCFFKGRVATWVFFYGPMGVVILCNSVLYTVTAIRLCRHRRETTVLKRGDSRKHDCNDKERFNLCLKLFIVMGINWVFELVSYMFGNEVPKYMWYATDVTNTLQGLFIFLIFVWEKRVRRLVWNKLCKSRAQNNGEPRGSIQTTQILSTSSGSLNGIKLKQVNI